MLVESVYQPQCQSDCHHAVVQRTSSITAHHGDFGPPQCSEASLKHYNARPSSEQLRSCSDILSSAMGGRPQQSQQPSLPGPSNPLSLNLMVVNDLRNTAQQFVKYQPQALSSLFSNCQVNNVQVFMGHNSAGFH